MAKNKVKTNEKTVKAAADARARAAAANPETAPEEAEPTVDLDVSELEDEADDESAEGAEGVDGEGAEGAEAAVEGEVEAAVAEPTPEWAPPPDVQPLWPGGFAKAKKLERERRQQAMKDRMRARTQGLKRNHQKKPSHLQRSALKAHQPAALPAEALEQARQILLQQAQAPKTKVSRSAFAKNANASVRREHDKARRKARSAQKLIADAEALTQWNALQAAQAAAAQAAEAEASPVEAPPAEPNAPGSETES